MKSDVELDERLTTGEETPRAEPSDAGGLTTTGNGESSGQTLAPAGQMVVVRPRTSAAFAEWDEFVKSHPHGRHYNLSWWLQHHARRFVESGVTGVKRGSAWLAGAAWYRFGLPLRGFNVTVISNALLVRADAPEALPELLRAIESDCRLRGSFLLQFEAFSADLTEPIHAYFADRRPVSEPLWKLYHPGNWRDLRIALAPHTEDEVLKSFSQLARRQIRKAEGAGVDIVRTTDEADIRMAYDMWREFAARKALRNLRTYDDFRGMIEKAEAHGASCLLIAKVDSEPAAVTFSVFYGSGAAWLISAYRDKHREIPCTRLLLWRTMQLALREGIPYLTMGGPLNEDSGVTEFKMRFNPELLDYTRFATVPLMPRMAALAQSFIGQVKWAGKLKRWYISREGGGTDMTVVGRQDDKHADRDDH